MKHKIRYKPQNDFDVLINDPEIDYDWYAARIPIQIRMKLRLVYSFTAEQINWIAFRWYFVKSQKCSRSVGSRCCNNKPAWLGIHWFEHHRYDKVALRKFCTLHQKEQSNSYFEQWIPLGDLIKPKKKSLDKPRAKN